LQSSFLVSIAHIYLAFLLARQIATNILDSHANMRDSQVLQAQTEKLRWEDSAAI